MSVILKESAKKDESRANGLQDSHLLSDLQSLLPVETKAILQEAKQELANSTNPMSSRPYGENHPRSKWTDVNYQPTNNHPQETQQQQQMQPPQGQYNQHGQCARHPQMTGSQGGQWPQQQQQQMSYNNNNNMMQYNPQQQMTGKQPVGQVTNGLPEQPEPRQVKQFNAKNSALLANAPDVNLQQSSMANGLLQNQQQRNQQPLDNSWTGQAPPQDGTGEASPKGAQQQQQVYEVIQSSAPGKPPQFVLRNTQDMYQGFPAQRNQQMGLNRFCPRHMTGGMPGQGQMMPQMMMGMPGMAPGMTPGMGPGMTPGMGPGMTPGMGPAMMTQPMTTMPTMAAMPQTMPPAMAREMMAQPTVAQPGNAYPYGYGAPSGNHAYQPAYGANHGMHGQGANTTVCQNQGYQ